MPTLTAPAALIYAAFMPRHVIITPSLRDATYVGRMAFRTRTGECQQPTSARFWSRPHKCERISYWRWLLFAAMARLELREHLYLRIPNAKTTRHDVTVDDYAGSDPSTLGDVSYSDSRQQDALVPANTAGRHDSQTIRMNSRILDFLAGMDVMLDLDVVGRRQVLEAIAMRMASVKGLNSETVFHALWRREQAASTAIRHGVALPHARVGGIEQPMLLLARTRQPIPFGAPDGKPVSIFFTIVVPEHANDDHLQILAFVAERFSNNALRIGLQAATSPSVVKRLFG